ncbi:hypothetical protein [Parasitella parasitica]|uniref:PH domain-containing protein n=1 Tax=Parasitella parasitica TaxID=35722 RepID=A0A0B7MW46_9FUNG|nr:hypothetical protein [Parasitella parasitica]
MNKKYTVITPQHQLYSPTAGWLSKMVSLPFGRSRWISRYFVLLDSELRFYKDEYSEVASQVLNLRQIAQVIPASTLQHPFCFRLEPKQQPGDHVLKPWIMECKSESDMETWICAIQSRIIKYSPAPSPLLLHQKSPTKSNASNRNVSIASLDSVRMTSPEVYRMPMLPLRCTNLIRGEEDDSTRESLLSRRNKKLAPIVTQSSSSSFICSPQPSLPLYSSSISAVSSTSTLPSPTGAVLGYSLLISPGIIDRYSNYTSKDAGNNQAPLVSQGVLEVQHQEKKECDTISLESSSPTYLMYKKRFRL